MLTLVLSSLAQEQSNSQIITIGKGITLPYSQNINGPINLSLSPSNSTDWRPSPTGAALRSLALPGWGQAYNRKSLKALLAMGTESGLIYSIYRYHKLQKGYRLRGEIEIANLYREDRNRLSWYLAGTIILTILDAYVDAQLYDFDVSDEKPTDIK